MRLLYLSPANYADYQCDMLFHGLRTLFGTEVVDVNRLSYMYADTFRDDPEAKCRLYGKGFTLYGLLPPDDGVDRTDIERKIRARHFDAVIYGSIHRSQMFLPEVLNAYPPQDILFIDGEDYPRQLYWPLMNRGLYFKRENDGASPALLPIHFAIPPEKIVSGTTKTELFAFIDPRDRSTYIYDREEDYHADYRRSCFGVTMKKAGWDCLRHYEIMANRCVPFFVGLDACPPTTMHRFPRYEIWWLNHLLQTRGGEYFQTTEGVAAWQAGVAAIGRFLEDHLTTTALARYVVECWRRARVGDRLAPFPD
jgi:hypothetical protein